MTSTWDYSRPNSLSRTRVEAVLPLESVVGSPGAKWLLTSFFSSHIPLLNHLHPGASDPVLNLRSAQSLVRIIGSKMARQEKRRREEEEKWIDNSDK